MEAALKPEQSLPALPWPGCCLWCCSSRCQPPSCPATCSRPCRGALLIALADAPGAGSPWARWASVLMAAVMAAAFWIAAPLAVQIDSPEIPALAQPLSLWGLGDQWRVVCLSCSGWCGLLLRRGGRWPGSWLLALQLPWWLGRCWPWFPPVNWWISGVSSPCASWLSRCACKRGRRAAGHGGVNKPSLHYYSRKVVLMRAGLPVACWIWPSSCCPRRRARCSW